MTRTHLFLALGSACWGENLVGMRAARDLARAGERCVLVADVAAARMFRDSGLDVRLITVGEDRIVSAIRAERPATIVLADFLMTDLELAKRRVDPRFLLQLGIPTVAIDTWSTRESGRVQDTFGGKETAVSGWIDQLTLRLVPVPFARPSIAGGCAVLPAPVDRAVRAGERTALGLDPDDRAVLLTTADWQHASAANDEAGRALAGAVLAMIGRGVSRAGATVVHVGPQPLAGLAGAVGEGRYRHLHPQRPARFARTLACADLVLSLNVSASTVAAAIVSSIPVVVLTGASDRAPLFPFWAWPIGLRRFLDPVLAGNPYLDALITVDVTDETRFADTLRALLLEPDAAAALAARQAAYVARVAALPGAAATILGLVT